MKNLPTEFWKAVATSFAWSAVAVCGAYHAEVVKDIAFYATVATFFIWMFG